jgi:hypothetical protein
VACAETLEGEVPLSLSLSLSLSLAGARAREVIDS